MKKYHFEMIWMKNALKTNFELTSMLFCDNKSWTISKFSFSTAIFNAVSYNSNWISLIYTVWNFIRRLYIKTILQ